MMGVFGARSERWYSETRSPFAELGCHFFLGLFHPEGNSNDDSFTTWIVQVLAVLITASLVYPDSVIPALFGTAWSGGSGAVQDCLCLRFAVGAGVNDAADRSADGAGVGGIVSSRRDHFS